MNNPIYFGARCTIIFCRQSDPHHIALNIVLQEPMKDGSGKKGMVLRNVPFYNIEYPQGLSQLKEFIINLKKQRKATPMNIESKIILSTPEEFKKPNEWRSSSLSDLVTIYNNLVPEEKKIKKFSDRETAIKRLTKLFIDENRGEPLNPTDEQKASFRNKLQAYSKQPNKSVEETVEAKGKKINLNLTLNSEVTMTNEKNDPSIKPIPPAPKNKITLMGRRSKFSGKKIYVIVESNPRREGTEGHQNYELYASGLSYEDYIKKGGKANHLTWDIEHKYVEVK